MCGWPRWRENAASDWGAPGCCGVYLNFTSATGKPVTDPGLKAKGGQAVRVVDAKDAAAWTRYTLPAKAPPWAATVAVWVHSFAGAAGLVDLDDFAVSGIAADAVPVAPPPARKLPPALSAADLAKLPPRPFQFGEQISSRGRQTSGNAEHSLVVLVLLEQSGPTLDGL